jgi:hypothetical protein
MRGSGLHSLTSIGLLKNSKEIIEKVALRRSEAFFDHSKVRFTANERRRHYFVPQRCKYLPIGREYTQIPNTNF